MMNLLTLWRKPSDQEFDGSVSSRRLRRAMDESGVFLVRRAMTPAQANELKEVIFEIYDLVGADIERNIAIDETLDSNFRRWQGIWLTALPGFLAGRSSELNERLAAVCACTEKMVDGFFGGRAWGLNRDRSFFRRHSGDANLVGWHMDADTAVTANGAAGCINVWMPLQDVGQSAPSLEFIVGSHARMKREKFVAPGEFRPNEWVDALPGKRWTPSATLGDAIVFEHYTLHRTQLLPPSKLRRTSCEFRFTER